MPSLTGHREAPWGVVLAPAVGTALMSLSTIVVAANAQLLRRVDLSPRPVDETRDSDGGVGPGSGDGRQVSKEQSPRRRPTASPTRA